MVRCEFGAALCLLPLSSVEAVVSELKVGSDVGVEELQAGVGFGVETVGLKL